jgi:hypothetical protein
VQLFETGVSGKDHLVSSLDITIEAKIYGPFEIEVGIPKLEAEIKTAGATPKNIKCPEGSSGVLSRAEVEVRLISNIGITIGPVGGSKPKVLDKTNVTLECLCCCWNEWPRKNK